MRSELLILMKEALRGFTFAQDIGRGEYPLVKVSQDSVMEENLGYLKKAISIQEILDKYGRDQ